MFFISAKKHSAALKKRFPKILYIIVLFSFIIPIIFISAMLILGTAPDGGAGYHSRSDYVLMLVECILGLFVIHIPSLLEKKLKFEVPTLLYVLYMLFLYCAIFLGEVRSFYYLIPNWDTFLHAFSSVMTGLLGYMFVTILNRDERIIFKLSPFFIALFAFCFSVTVGSLWEIYEYTFDGLLGLDMQKHTLAGGNVLVGHAALSDTMKDIIVDACGALVASAIGYFSIRKGHWYVATLKEDDKASEAPEEDDE